MLEPLTRILLWAAVGLIIWYVLLRLIPRNYLTWFGGLVVLVLIVLSFVDRDSETVEMIWDIISLPLNPLGLSVLFLAFSLKDGSQKVNGNQVVAAFLVLLLASMPLISRFLVNRAEQSVQEAFNNQLNICVQVCPEGQATLAEVGNTMRAIVVLGDSQMDTGQLIETVSDEEGERPPSPTTAMVPRLLRAASLYGEVRARGGAPWMIVTMKREDSEKEQAKATAIRQQLSANGVPIERIEVQALGTDIRKSADEAREFLEGRQLIAPGQRIMVVTPALSMRRASLTFSKVFRDLQVRIVARPTGFYITRPDNSDDLLVRLRDLFPSVEALSTTSRVVDEYLTWGYYFLRGWLPGFNVIWTNVVEVWGQ
ncbi:MAG: YdcF family protein [Leptolyngbyaceae cyanobacterium MO_188.B28]|nr:YdcF family protein [Leptolyngbyaceae cyanobacterium MO_188.B28]